MARMPDIFAEVEHDLGHLLRHRHDAPQPAAPPASPHNVIRTQEVPPMQLLDEIEAHVKAAADKLGAVDHQALDALELVLANPATAEGFQILAGLTHLPPVTLATGLDVLRMIQQREQAANIVPPAAPAPLPQPLGPVTGGVALTHLMDAGRNARPHGSPTVHRDLQAFRPALQAAPVAGCHEVLHPRRSNG